MEAIDYSEGFTPYLIGRVVAGLFLACTGGYILSRVILSLAMRPMKKHSLAHWTERARFIHPVRITATISTILVATILGMFMAIATFRVSPDLPVEIPTLPFVLATGIGSLAAYLTVRPELLLSPVSLRAWLRAKTTLVALVGANWIILLFMSSLMPEVPGWGTLVVFVATMLLLACVALDAHVILLKHLGLLRPASERLTRIVAAAAARTNTPYREVFEADLGMANAMVFESRRDVLFTSEALTALDDSQIDAICCHEFAHLNESPSAHRLRFGKAFIFLPFVLFGTVLNIWGFLPAVLGCVVSCFILLICYQKFSQKMEHAADAFAARFVEDPRIYSKALERLHEVNLMPAVMAHNRESHPHLYDRLLATGMQPDYPRPPSCASCSRLGIAVGLAAIPIYLILIVVLDVFISKILM